MSLPNLTHNFHDASITDLKIGPRREVLLTLVLDDPAFTANRRVLLRFGGITNMDEVSRFLERMPELRAPYAYRGRINTLQYDPLERSTHGKLVLLLDVEGLGLVRIQCRNITEEE